MSTAECQPLTSYQCCDHFDIDRYTSTIEQINHTTSPNNNASHKPKGATVVQTSLNIAKLCMGTGTLALPFAAQKGGLLFNGIGLGLIGLWNYLSANCLLRCLEYVPSEVGGCKGGGGCNGGSSGRTTVEEYGAAEQHTATATEDGMTIQRPPEGTTTYGVVAWYALGQKGLMILDLLMLLLFVGLLIAYEGELLSLQGLCCRTIVFFQSKVNILI